MTTHESETLRAERHEQNRGPHRSAHSVVKDEWDSAWDAETYQRPCPGCGTPGALHVDVCPPDPFAEGLRWCDFCLGPLRPDEANEKPCDRCEAEKRAQQEDWDD